MAIEEWKQPGEDDCLTVAMEERKQSGEDDYLPMAIEEWQIRLPACSDGGILADVRKVSYLSVAMKEF